jgi:hypothetical protein
MRTFVRTGDRHAAKVFIADKTLMILGNPLVGEARIAAEQGRIEFKAFDALPDFSLYASLAALIKGLVLAPAVGQTKVPDKALHRRAAERGWSDAEIYAGAKEALARASEALTGDPDHEFLMRLMLC